MNTTREVSEALEPFAKLADEIDALNHEEHSTCMHRIAAADLRRAKAVLAALSSPSASPVVKGLEWYSPSDGFDTLVKVETPLGVYRVYTYHEANGRWFWSLDGYEKASGEAASEALAVAAAQADYEERILSALAPSPVEPVAINAELLRGSYSRHGWAETISPTRPTPPTSPAALPENIAKLLTAAESHLSASKGDGWRTMESAPREPHKSVLIASKFGTRWTVCEAHYVKRKKAWYAVGDYGDEEFSQPYKPTRWQPLPPAPDGISQSREVRR